MAVGRDMEALQIFEGAARWNNRDVTAVKEAIRSLRSERDDLGSERKVTFADLMRTPNLRRNSLSLFLSWFLAGLSFFGFSQTLSKVGGNIFVTTVIAGETRNMIGWDNIVRSVDLQNIFRIQNICTTCYKD
jgi:hypothetical protein